MNKELLSYLANLAIVRNHVQNSILSISHGVIDKKTLHQCQAKVSSLDQLFIRVLLSGQVPDVSSTAVSEEDDYVNISKRIREEKSRLLGSSPVPAATPTETVKTPAQLALENDEEENPSTEDDDEEVKTVADILMKAEKETKKRGRKKAV